MGMKVTSLTSAFGFDRRAHLIAESMGVTLNWANIQKVLAILAAWRAAYRGPLIPQLSGVTDLRILAKGVLPKTLRRVAVNGNRIPAGRGSLSLSR
jgi:hypothetical protein